MYVAMEGSCLSLSGGVGQGEVQQNACVTNLPSTQENRTHIINDVSDEPSIGQCAGLQHAFVRASVVFEVV